MLAPVANDFASSSTLQTSNANEAVEKKTGKLLKAKGLCPPGDVVYSFTLFSILKWFIRNLYIIDYLKEHGPTLTSDLTMIWESIDRKIFKVSFLF